MNETLLAKKLHPTHRTVIRISDRLAVGDETLLVIAGPCSVESFEQMDETARRLLAAPVQMLRGGIFKPRSSPYSFQGLGDDGLQILSTIKGKYSVPVITEVMAIEQLTTLSTCADVLQIGSRNMQNFDLLKAVGKLKKPVMLKRGFAATLEEFIYAAEYILSQGNPNVMLCERGIRSFDSYTRNVLDLGAVVALKQITHLPIIVDPSHAAGKRELVADLAKAAVAAGADGIMIECHPEPDKSISDARQALSLDEMVDLVTALHPIADAVGRYVERCEKVAPIASFQRQSTLATVTIS